MKFEVVFTDEIVLSDSDISFLAGMLSDEVVDKDKDEEGEKQ